MTTSCSFSHFFQKSFPAREPYAYQAFLAAEPLASRLINIPTGLGKTAAVIHAWLWNRVWNQRADWPRRLVYCLPMRTLVEQTYNEAQKWLTTHNILWDGKPENHKGKVGLHLLMGGEDAGEWNIYPEENAILIGTQDMLLSRALNRGYGMSRFRWPMHFGLLNNDCLWVMDETQLMGPGLWTSGQLDWMRNQRFGTMKPCVTWWMSATNSPAFLETPDRKKYPLELAQTIEIVDDTKALARLNPVRPLSFWKRSDAKAQPKKKASSALIFEEALAAAIRAGHALGTLSLIVCNTVKAAQQLYRQLEGENTILLTSRFRRTDRNTHTRRLLDFEEQRKAHSQGSGDDSLPDHPGLICVSTQIIEAGADISARRLWLEAAPWPSVLQRLGRLNRDGRADGKANAFVFQWPPEEGKKAKGQQIGPYEAKDIEASLKLLAELEIIYQNKPTLGAKDAMEKLRASSAAVMVAALKPKDEPFPRAMDIHGLFSTEPDLFGGFTDVSPWVRGNDKNADVIVFWREFDAKKGPGKTDSLIGPAFDAKEGCTVAVHSFRDLIGEKGRALVWDERTETWQSTWVSEICPGMVVMLPRTAGGYSTSLGWTGIASDKLAEVPTPGPFSDRFVDDTASKQADWVTLETHLADTKAAATRITDALHLDPVNQVAVITAAEWHDIGKAHSIWQSALPTTADESAQLWAKAPFFQHLPRPSPSKPCIRHEAASALAAWSHYFKANPSWPGLTIFLIACHHGKVRTEVYARGDDGEDVCGVPKEPAILPWQDGMLMDFSCAIAGTSGEFSEDGLTFTPAAPGWTALVADLLGGWEPRPQEFPPPNALRTVNEPRQFGPFSLAYLEALICAADIQASKNSTQVRHV